MTKCTTFFVFLLLLPSGLCWAPSYNSPRPPRQSKQQQQDAATDSVKRRQVLQQVFGTTAVILGTNSWLPVAAHAEDTSTPTVFSRQTANFQYQITTPPTFAQSQKPVKTHLDEINFVSSQVKGYQYGITVDPVRINTLKEFGTPEQVAARVVTAEINRDGVFDVTLLQDPYESKDGAYILEYLSSGKRGNKHFVTKIFIRSQQLYVLTAQVKEDNYLAQKEELGKTVESFTV